MKANKRIQNRFKKEKDLLDICFKQMTPQQRLSYMYFVCLVQTSYYYLFNRTIQIESIHSFFLNKYINNCKDGILNLDYKDMAINFLKETNHINYNNFEDNLIYKLSRSYKHNFQNIEDYLQFYINEKTDERNFKKINEFVG